MTNIRIPQRAYGLLSRNTHPASGEAQANDDDDGASLHCRVHVLWLHIIHTAIGATPLSPLYPLEKDHLVANSSFLL